MSERLERETRGGGMAGAFAGFQNEIYVASLEDVGPELPTDLTKLEALAAETMPADAFGYVAGSAGSEATARANRVAFERWQIVPRMLRDVSGVDLTATVLGTSIPAPLLLAPVGVLSIVHPEASARWRARPQVSDSMVVSTAASTSLEDVAKAERKRPALVPALLAEGQRARRQLPRARSGGAVRRSRPHTRHVHDGLAASRPRQRVPAVPPWCRQPELLRRPGLPGPRGRAGRRRHPRGGRAALGRDVREPGPHLGRSRLPPLARPPDRAQGDPAPRRCAPRRRRRCRRCRRLEPRGTPGGRRRGLARRAPSGRRGGRGSRRGAVRQRRPDGSGRRQGTRPRPRAGPARPALRLRPRPPRGGRCPPCSAACSPSWS